MSEEKTFCRIPVKLIIKLGENFQYDAFLKLSDSKIVKISHHDEPIKDAIVRYHVSKGVEDIFVTKEDYTQILESFKKLFSNKLFDPESTIQEKSDLLEKSYTMIKDSLIGIGIDEQSIEMAKKISEGTTRLVKESNNVFNLLKNFSTSCPEEFKKSLIIGYLCSGIIDTFDWGSDSIKEKCSLSAMLCDILLSPQEIETIQKLSKTLPLSPPHKSRIGSHPLKIVQSLKVQSWISKETLSMIEQHHEEPDGLGFPLGLAHNRISQLSAIFIVACRFADILFEKKFDFKQKESMLLELKAKYNIGVFKRAYVALDEMLSN